MSKFDDFQWSNNADLSPFKGQWVAILDKKVIANGNDLKKVVKESEKKYPKKKAIITKVSKDDILVI